MKPLSLLTLYLIICTNLLEAQKQIAPPPLRTPGSLHPIPLAYTGLEPDIYLPGDSVRLPHIRTHIVEFNSNIQVDNNYLIEGLKKQGKQEGVDGIILHDYRKLLPGTDAIIGSISGIGIKYLNRIDYLDTILKQKVVSIYEPNGNRGKTVIIEYDWFGNILNNYEGYDVQFYADSMAFIDLNIIFNRIAEFYVYRAFEGQPVHKIVSHESWPFKIIHTIEPYTYEIKQLTTSKQSREISSEKNLKVKIKPVYNGDLLTGAIITAKNNRENPLYYLHYKYGTNGRITEERWEKLIEGKRILWLEVQNRYFETNPEFLQSLTNRTFF